MGRYFLYNPNPSHKRVGDCVVRAISKALNQDWEQTYLELAIKGLDMADMPSSNAVWGAFLKERGFKRKILPHDHDDFYTLADFADDHRNGTYIVALPNHVVCVQNGKIFDTWDSSDEAPIYYFEREDH